MRCFMYKIRLKYMGKIPGVAEATGVAEGN